MQLLRYSGDKKRAGSRRSSMLATKYRLVGVCTSLCETMSLPTSISIPCSTDLSSEVPIQFHILAVPYSQLARSGCRQRTLVYQADQSMSNTIHVSVLVSSPPADARPKNATKNRAGCAKLPYSTSAGHLFKSAPQCKTVVPDARKYTTPIDRVQGNR